MKMLTLKHPLPELSNDEAYKLFVDQVVDKVPELGAKILKLYGKLPAKQEDIFEPTIKIEIGLNKFNALCDPGASGSTITKSVYENLNLGFFTSEIKLKHGQFLLYAISRDQAWYSHSN